MYATAGTIPPSRSVLERLLVRSWEYRRPRRYAGVRIACGIFNVVLGVALLASVPWTGPLALLGVLPLAGAALIFWTVYRLRQCPASGSMPGAGVSPARWILGPRQDSSLEAFRCPHPLTAVPPARPVLMRLLVR